MKPVITTLVLIVTYAATASGQTYSTDLRDMQFRSRFTPIGDVGKLEKIIDLRGFLPLSTVSKKKSAKQDESVANFFTDIYQWFKISTRDGVVLAYYDLGLEEARKKLKDVPIRTERDLNSEDTVWAKFAYGLARDSGPKLFATSGGGSGLISTEPVFVLFTPNSAIVVLSFKYSGIDRKGTGQIISAFEFSRKFGQYRTMYDLYSTTILNRSTKEAFDKSAPIITRALKAYLRLRR